MSDVLPKTRSGNVIGNQVLRSSTSMAANYRAAGRARSKAEFIAKLGIVIEEADETVFWLELLRDSGIIKPAKLESMLSEANQLFGDLYCITKDGQSLKTKTKNNADHRLTRLRAMTAITRDDGDLQKP